MEESENCPLSGKNLIRATRPFAKENRAYSWFAALSTAGLFGLAVTGALLEWFWPLRLLCGALAGLLLVRLFVIYHDHQHNAILSNSKLADQFMRLVGLMALAPSSVWRHTHNTHHTHNSKLHHEAVGSFPVMTQERFAKSSPLQRFGYLIVRHPLTLALGYLTTFLGSMCLRPFIENPREHYDGLIALLLHLTLAASVTIFFGWMALVFAMLLPFTIAASLGAYLFYAQHNFPGVVLHEKDGWSFEGAALESSSYMKMPRIMHWFTANIGYHHIHHLNSRIPFYRLPEAYREVAELQTDKTTSLAPWDVLRCLRLKLWDSKAGRMVPLRNPQ